MSLLQVILTFKTGEYTVTRRAAESLSSGVASAGSSTTFEIEACVQPISGRDLLALREGQRAEETKVIFTETALRTRTSAGAADRISIDGDTYEVFNVRKWDTPEETFYKALAAKVGRP